MRFFAPLCVFCLGMSPSSSLSGAVVGRSGAGSAGVAGRDGDLVGDGTGRIGGRRLLLVGGLLGLLQVGRVLVRREDHDHVAAVLLGRRLHEAELRDVLAEPLQQPVPELGPGLLASAEHDRDLDLVALLEEADHMALLRRVVVRVDLRAELHLLDDGEDLVLAALTRLLSGLVLELAVVHELAHRWPGHRSDLDEIEVALLGQLQGLVDRDDADLLALRTDQPYLGDTDPVVDAGFCADGASWFGRTCRDPGAFTKKGPALSAGPTGAQPAPRRETGRGRPDPGAFQLLGWEWELRFADRLDEQAVGSQCKGSRVEPAERDLAEVPAAEVIAAVAVHLMSAAAVKCGLSSAEETDLDEARKLITALAGLVTAARPDLGIHAAPLRDGLQSLQKAFREASAIADDPGDGPGEKLTGPVG